MVSIPPHTSHRLQPLDVTFFGPLKNSYSRQCNLFLKSKITNSQFEDKITPYDVAEIFKLAYTQVANVEKGVSGFAACGIFPLNPDKFSEDDFAASNNLKDMDNSQHSDLTIVNNQPLDHSSPQKKKD